MKRNPASKWHHVNLLDPKVWRIFATKQFGYEDAEGRAQSGIQARLGRKKGGGSSKPVTLLFDPRLWTIDEAVAWAKKKRYEVREALEAPREPGHKLSQRAIGLHKGRTAVQLRDWLKRTGWGVALTREQAAALPGFLKTMKKEGVDEGCVAVLSCGFLLTPGFPEEKGSRALIVLPPDKEILGHLVAHLDAFLFQTPPRKKPDRDTWHAWTRIYDTIRDLGRRV